MFHTRFWRRERRRALRSAWVALGLAGAVGAVAVFAPAATASPPTVSCGDTISTPGTYVLGADCSSSGITITSSNVTLKLGGHTMTGPGVEGTSRGVLVDDSGGALSGVAIKGPGTITGYRDGVDLGKFGGAGVSGSTVSGLTTTGVTFGISVDSAASANTVSDNTADNNVFSIVVDGSANTVNNNAAENNRRVGIILEPPASANTINNNTADNNFFSGIIVDSGASGNTINNNTADNNGQDLVDFNPNCDSNTWRSNTFNTAFQPCIR